MNTIFFRKLYILVLVLISAGCFLQGCARFQDHAPNRSCITSGWPHQQSDLSPDPALIFGTLNNGLRYVIMPNHEPRNRVGLYLDVQSGSMVETEQQRGLAHYLEHMLFNGTTHYPPGTLVEYFQSIGMGFGADTNAHTGYDETVYKLLLPSGDRKTLQTGLQVMADYARGALLLETEVENERGIILAEKRARDSAASRVFKARMKCTFAGTRIAKRDPIGTEETIKNANSLLLRQYYDKWYRPGNMILIVVGDADPELVKQIIETGFSALRAAGPAPPCPDPGKVAEQGTAAFYLHEPDLGYTSVSIESVWNEANRPDTRAREIRSLKEYVAGTMLNNRLQQLVNQEGSPLTGANFYSGRVVKLYGNSSLTARTSAEDWQQALELLDKTLRQVLTFGFLPDELDRAKREVLVLLKKQQQQADTRDSRKLADDIIYKLNNNEVVLSPDQELQLYTPVLQNLTVDQVNKAFHRLWHKRRLIEVTGTADLAASGTEKAEKLPPESVILAVYNQSEQQQIKPWTTEQLSSFPYLDFSGKAVEVTRHVRDKDLGVDNYVFENGLILNLKQTDFAQNEVIVSALLGNGRLTEPVPGLGRFAEDIIRESGVGGLSKEQLQAALSGYSARVAFTAAEDSFRFTGKGLSSEVELLFQLIATHLRDPAFSTDACRRVREELKQRYTQLLSSAEGMMQLQGERFLAGGNPRYGIVPFSEIQQFRLEQVQQWLTPVLSDAALEISVVGDFNREAVVALAGKYFSEPRNAYPPVVTGQAIDFPSGKNRIFPVASKSDRALVTAAWPTDDFWDISRTRRLSILAAILDDRLRKQIREELGATYSPVVYNRSSRVDPGYGVLRAQMIVAPDQAEMLSRKLVQVGSGIAQNAVTDDELERALQPVLTSIRDLVRSNRYWMESVLAGSSRHPLQLEWPKTILKDFSSITKDDIQKLAARYLQKTEAATVIIIPKGFLKK